MIRRLHKPMVSSVSQDTKKLNHNSKWFNQSSTAYKSLHNTNCRESYILDCILCQFIVLNKGQKVKHDVVQ